MAISVNKRSSPEANQPFEANKRQKTEGSLDGRTVTILPDAQGIPPAFVQEASQAIFSAASGTRMDSIVEISSRYRNGDYSWVKERCEAILKTDPDDDGMVQVMLGLAFVGLALEREGEWDEAIGTLTKAIKRISLLSEDTLDHGVKSILFGSFYKLGNCFFEKGKYSEVISILKEVPFKNLGFDHFYCKSSMRILGKAHMGLKNYKEAINCFTEVLQANKNDSTSLYLIGRCYLSLNFPTIATSYFLRIHSNASEYDCARASIFEASLETSSETPSQFYYSSLKDNFEKGKFDWIIKNCKEVKESIEWYIIARAYLGVSLAITGKYEEAKEVLIEVIRNGEPPPKNLPMFGEIRAFLDRCYYELGECFFISREFSKAIQCLKQISNTNQKIYELAKKGIKKCKQKALKKEKAVDLLFAKISISTSMNPAHLCAMGSEYFSSGQYVKAEYLFNQVLPDSGEYYTYARGKLAEISKIESQATF